MSGQMSAGHSGGTCDDLRDTSWVAPPSNGGDRGIRGVGVVGVVGPLEYTMRYHKRLKRLLPL